MRAKELIIYKHLEDGRLLEDMEWLMDHYGDDYYNKEDKEALFYECVHGWIWRDIMGFTGIFGIVI